LVVYASEIGPDIGPSGGSVVIYRTHTPAPPLSDFVDLLWYLEGYSVPHPRERVLPNGAIQIIIDLKHDRIATFTGENREIEGSVPPAIVAGASSEYVVIDTTTLDRIIGVQFKPGCAGPFLRVAASETLNRDVPLDAIWGGRCASELRDRLIEAPTVDRKFRILEGSLLDRARGNLTQNRVLHYAVYEFQSVPQSRSVAEVAAVTGFSAKRLIAMFREHVGMTPKLFCRIRRFQDALSRTASGKRVIWAQVAADCGYFDQAHFVRDFQAFSGINPTAYLLARGEWVNHLPD
jgi:AraC-like DNA-binding protein